MEDTWREAVEQAVHNQEQNGTEVATCKSSSNMMTVKYDLSSSRHTMIAMCSGHARGFELAAWLSVSVCPLSTSRSPNASLFSLSLLSSFFSLLSSLSLSLVMAILECTILCIVYTVTTSTPTLSLVVFVFVYVSVCMLLCFFSAFSFSFSFFYLSLSLPLALNGLL